MKKFLSLLLLLGLLTACFPSGSEKYQYFNLYAFVDVKGNTTVQLSITGDMFRVTDDQTDSKWMHEQTVFIFYDILDRTATGHYDIRIKAYKPVTRQLTRVKSQSSVEEYGSDAVSFYQDWGFNPKARTIDMACLYSSLKDSETEHRIYLVADDARSNADTLYLELHHQGHGESYENEAYEAKDFQVNTTFLRFDLGGVIPPEAGKQIVFSLEWDWLPTEDGAYLREQQHFQVFSTVTLSE